jgi:deazaflavin-dependent oxidoreductase (nitroreductase family)
MNALIPVHNRQMRLPRRMARFNRVVTNRVQRIWAPYLPPWVLIVHRGRRSGREYRTPLMASVRGDTLVIAMLYGPESDWARNLLAAGNGTAVRRGRTRTIDRFEIVESKGSNLGWPARVADHVFVARVE